MAHKEDIHTIVVTYKLTGEEYGTAEEREAIFALGDQISDLIDKSRVGGYFDGNEFGDGEARLYLYSPDAPKLLQLLDSLIKSFRNRPAYATVWLGEADDAPKKIIEL
ncbi:DUF695 domain-containing protein [Amycolatopsis suaedae]|uniref:DUF695 domain-containing protein n=1 Tax=Amycolatopsis suaedae TaxID=2510978 RepID=A0A4Q7IYM1_9PSEU|nr:DUF695 domain-containing protein [Amycolatopsis suaedae]RZQ59537.1 DUF695 domain-containing protein [Amycolatopsis suaedae]